MSIYSGEGGTVLMFITFFFPDECLGRDTLGNILNLMRIELHDEVTSL